MKARGILLTVGIVIALSAALVSVLPAVETPKYEVIAKSGDIEIRKYPALEVATSAVASPRKINGGFNRLFKFIDGGNSRKAKIAMTAPVILDDSPDQPSISFIMPADVANAASKEPDSMPQPANAGVVLSTIPSQLVATMRFKDGLNVQSREKAARILLEWLPKNGYTPLSPPAFAIYNPPWIPEVFCRNEVWVTVKAKDK